MLLDGEHIHSDSTRLVKRLRKQRKQLFTYRYVAGPEPANNVAEREIPMTVVLCKTSGGHGSDQGANAHAVLGSVIRTCQKQGRDFVGTAVELQVVGSGSARPPAVARRP